MKKQNASPRSFKMSDSFRQVQAFERAKSAESKLVLAKKAMKLVEDALRPTFGGMSLSVAGENLVEVSAGVFTGTINVTAGVQTSGGLKNITVPVTTENSEVSFKNPDHVVARVQEQLKSAKGSLDKQLAEKEKIIAAKAAAIEVKIAQDEEINKRVATGESVDKVTKEVRDGTVIPKEAKEYTFSDGAGGVVEKSLSEIPLILALNKQNLPSSIGPGDVINISGYRYKVQGSEPALSAGVNDGSRWLLQLLLLSE